METAQIKVSAFPQLASQYGNQMTKAIQEEGTRHGDYYVIRRDRYRQLIGRTEDNRADPNRPDCRYLGEDSGKTEQCKSCQGVVLVKIFTCEIHKLCTRKKHIPEEPHCCTTCLEYSPMEPSSSES